jgi:Ca2+-binding EF-hand superfamily protein
MDKQSRLIITTNEMRKALGKEYANLTDLEIGEIIVQVELMAEIAIAEIKKQLVVPTST